MKPPDWFIKHDLSLLLMLVLSLIYPLNSYYYAHKEGGLREWVETYIFVHFVWYYTKEMSMGNLSLSLFLFLSFIDIINLISGKIISKNIPIGLFHHWKRDWMKNNLKSVFSISWKLTLTGWERIMWSHWCHMIIIIIQAKLSWSL